MYSSGRTPKRPAGDQGGSIGSKSKSVKYNTSNTFSKESKPFINGRGGKLVAKGKQNLGKASQEKRQKRPITVTGANTENEEEDSVADEVMQGEDETDQLTEKRPRMSKGERAALHAAQPHRTALLASHPLLHDELLPVWELARRANLGKEERQKAVSDLWNAVKGRVAEISRGHKGGRVLQTVCTSR